MGACKRAPSRRPRWGLLRNQGNTTCSADLMGICAFTRYRVSRNARAWELHAVAEGNEESAAICWPISVVGRSNCRSVEMEQPPIPRIDDSNPAGRLARLMASSARIAACADQINAQNVAVQPMAYTPLRRIANYSARERRRDVRSGPNWSARSRALGARSVLFARSWNRRHNPWRRRQRRQPRRGPPGRSNLLCHRQCPLDGSNVLPALDVGRGLPCRGTDRTIRRLSSATRNYGRFG
jgi:hypothetical protein